MHFSIIVVHQSLCCVLSSLPACLSAVAQLAQQQLSSSAARATSWMPIIHLLLSAVDVLLGCWREMVECVPSLPPVVVRTLLPLVQQLQGCGSLLMQPAAAAAAQSAPTPGVQAGSSSSSSSICAHELPCVLFGVQHSASTLLNAIGHANS
jgi:hypothetical protein